MRVPRIEIKPNVDPLTDRELVLIKAHLQTLSDMSKGKEYKAVVNMESIVFKLHGSEQKGDKIRFKCGVCKLETSEDDLTDLHMGMGVTQYICVECQKLSFRLVMRRLGEHESPAYVGDTPLEEVQSSEQRVKNDLE